MTNFVLVAPRKPSFKDACKRAATKTAWEVAAMSVCAAKVVVVAPTLVGIAASTAIFKVEEKLWNNRPL